MQWGQIKTLFILCFLILNIYLLYLVIDKQKEADIGVIEREDATIEERLESEDISYDNLPELEEDKEPFLYVEQKTFSKDDKRALGKMNNQASVVLDDNYIISAFEDPIKIPDDATGETVSSLFESEIIYADNYRFWNWNEDLNVLVFFQEKNERPIYFNMNGLVLVLLNDDNEAVGYIQTMLGESEEGEEEKSLIQPIKVIESLYLSNQLNGGESVSDMRIGYHTRVPLADGMQVFVPTWKVKINDERDYYINAIEGFTFSGNDSEFLNETIETFYNYIRSTSSDHKDIKEVIMKELSDRQDEENGSEASR